MKVAVLGAGVIGEATAFLLSERGHDVVVVDRQAEPAAECSFANGGQLSYSHVEPWASRGVLGKIPEWLWKNDSPLVVSPSFDIRMWRWMVAFLMCCTKEKAEATMKNMMRLSLYSREKTHRIVARSQVDFSYRQTGTLHIFDKQSALECNIKQAAFLKSLGCPSEILSVEQCMQKEPALVESPYKVAGGLFFPLDESGDVHEFALKLAEASQRLASNVEYHYHTSVTQLIVEQNAIKGVKTNKGLIEAHAYILALGADSCFFLRQVGLPAPIYPMKGYSLSIPVKGQKNVPEMSLTDQGNKIVYTRLGDVLRVAGTAEFAGYNRTISGARIATLKRMVARSFPWLESAMEEAKEWACLRPSTADGAPLLGKTPIGKLFLNTGHGTLGWTLAAGSARIVADHVEGKEAEIDLTGLTIGRYLR
jgi:D-amino-acid dehydrogenase